MITKNDITHEVGSPTEQHPYAFTIRTRLILECVQQIAEDVAGTNPEILNFAKDAASQQILHQIYGDVRIRARGVLNAVIENGGCYQSMETEQKLKNLLEPLLSAGL